MDGAARRLLTALMGGMALIGGMVLLGGCEKKKEQQLESAGVTAVEEKAAGRRFYPADGELPVGWTAVTHLTMEAREIPLVVKVGEQEIEGTATTVTNKRTMWQILGKEKQRLTVQLHRDVSQATVGGREVPASTKTGVLLGEHLLLEKTKGTWTVRFESGKKASAEEQKELRELGEEMNQRNENQKQVTHEVGDEWVEGAGSFGEGEIKYRFDRVQSYQEQECAVLLGTIKATEKLPEGGSAVIEGAVRTFHSLDRFGPLFSEVIGTMEVTTFPEEGQTVTMRGPVRITETSVITVPEFH